VRREGIRRDAVEPGAEPAGGDGPASEGDVEDAGLASFQEPFEGVFAAGPRARNQTCGARQVRGPAGGTAGIAGLAACSTAGKIAERAVLAATLY
jgi:hypothetical protein